jgi:hypothetical protein
MAQQTSSSPAIDRITQAKVVDIETPLLKKEPSLLFWYGSPRQIYPIINESHDKFNIIKSGIFMIR